MKEYFSEDSQNLRIKVQSTHLLQTKQKISVLQYHSTTIKRK